jgi:Xaa-Pro dipeptidase
MKVSRRTLLKAGALAGMAPAFAMARPERETPQQKLGPSFDKLKPLGKRVQPITAEEYAGRLALARRFMGDAKPAFAALYVTPGTSLYYYTGIRWWPSERLLALLVPRKGDPVVICPAFEEGRLRELLPWPMEVRVWQEDESPYEVAAKWLAERGIRTGRIAVEERTTFAFYDGLRRAAHALEYASADPVTIGCRAQKTDHELDLMRLSCEATIDVYRAVFAALQTGMTQYDVAGLVADGFTRMGLEGGALVLFGKWAAQPHGTREPQRLEEGQVVLMDGGTTVEGYQSDITRCTVLGQAPDKVKRAFTLVRQAQDAALMAAVTGHECGSVDNAARAVLTNAGFGPGYKFFTHRLGHGIGLDGHEWPYLVKGNHTSLVTGMTFSNEPGIYVPGDYGLRLEDDMVIAETGEARLLTPGFSTSLEKPVD